jgi:hypothetical protein
VQKLQKEIVKQMQEICQQKESTCGVAPHTGLGILNHLSSICIAREKENNLPGSVIEYVM